MNVAKIVVVVLIVALAAVAWHRYTSNDTAEESKDLSDIFSEGLTDTVSTAAVSTGDADDEEWDKPYSKELAERIEEAETGIPRKQTEDAAAMAGNKAIEVFNADFSADKEDFPVVKQVALEEKTRYNVAFEADKEIRFTVFPESSYNFWIDTASYGKSKATTNSASGCCSSAGSYSVEVNENEGGTYYFVFDSKGLAGSDIPSKLKLTVTKTGNI
jgi:hypothetical protein